MKRTYNGLKLVTLAESVVATAIRFPDGRTVSGHLPHAFLYDRAYAEGLMPKPSPDDMTGADWKWVDDNVEDGFLSDDGSFLTRGEAAEVAAMAGQVDARGVSFGELHSDDL